MTPDTWPATVTRIELKPGLDVYIIIDRKPDGCVHHVRVTGLHIGCELRQLAESIAGAINAQMERRVTA